MNRREGKKIGIVMTAAVLLTIVICTSLAAAAIDSFTITPQKGIASRADAYTAVVTSSAGFNEINITIPAGFGALAPTTGGPVVARVDLFNTTEARAYYGYVELKSNGTNPGTKVDVKCKIGADEATTTQDIDYSAGGVTPITSPFAGGGTLATLTMPTATVDGTFSLDLSAIPDLKIKMATVDTGLFVRNPIADTYTFDADGTTEDVTITWPTADCALAIAYNSGWWEFKYGPVYNIPNYQPADHWLAYGTGVGTPIEGDFNDDGIDDIGIRYNNGWWEFKYGPVDDILNCQPADHWLMYGIGTGTPIVGDFNDDNIDDIGIRYNDGWWEFKYGPVDDILNCQPADHWLMYGIGTGTPVVGDFNDDGIDDMGIRYNNGWWEFKYGPVDDILNCQPADHWLAYGTGAGTPLVCDFDNDGIDGIGIRYNNGWWEFKYGPVDDIPNYSAANHWLAYGTGAGTPIVGSFNP
jgi:hypothetical protein